jgi:hypothetical protein
MSPVMEPEEEPRVISGNPKARLTRRTLMHPSRTPDLMANGSICLLAPQSFHVYS